MKRLALGFVASHVLAGYLLGRQLRKGKVRFADPEAQRRAEAWFDWADREASK